ncbi:uncharacterized protein LAESUDRAFT_762119 [Laetiporus sulphureus 93-53]|uniref:Uncharacterized protein n=1 Tax=Laetiporus sulphureus 93-53 TaxID=1314785 RepID=A0A165CS37_9APHY|nr:uncharacterized protein LAESUDRAFT_762119 [Laetiporus sulphureus 93-53]KZT03341.1 hypothetical protein LAESUDRAFT_762119 [Laetiporus sulphureus 93-53]
MPQLHENRLPPNKARAIIYSDEEEDIQHDRTRLQTSTHLVEHLFDDDVPYRSCSHSTGQDNQQDEDDQQEDKEQEDDGIKPRHFEKLIREMHYSKADKSKLDVWSDAARLIPRAMGPFIDILQTLQVSIACHGVAKDAWDLTDWPYLDEESASKLIEHYSTLLRIIPGLAKLVLHFENEPEDLVHFATFFAHNAEVFGKGPRPSSEDSAQLYVGPSSLDLLAQQHAVRHAMTQVATPPLLSEDGRSEIEEPIDASTSLRA